MIIYKATNKVNGKSYIGQTTRPLQRRSYCHKLSTHNGSSTYFHNAIRKYGFDSFGWQVLETCQTKEELDEMEYHYIIQYDTFCGKTKSGYNLTLGGEGTQLFGNTNGMYGVNHSTKSLDKMSLARSGGKTTTITYPDGSQDTITNLRGWCRDNKMDRASVYDIINGRRQTTYKGMWFEKTE